MNDPSEGHLYVASLRDAPSVHQQPRVDLRQWQVSALTGGALVLNGFITDSPTIRTTTPIVAVENGHVITLSGRAYRLLGEPANDPDALDLIAQKMALAGHSHFQDVTAAFVLHLRDAEHKAREAKKCVSLSCRD